MSTKVQAIVIKSSDKKEKDKSILLFSLENGKIWATLRGVKGANAKMKLAQNAFCYGDFVLEEGKSGKIVTNFEVIETFHEIAEDVDKYFEASAILEIVNNLVFSSEMEQAQVFVLTLKALKAICFGKIKPVYVLDKFLLELYSLFGFPVYSDKCTCCGTKAFEKMYLDYGSGQLVCVACKTFSCDEISRSTYMAMKIVNNTNFDRLESISLAGDSQLDLLRVLSRNFEFRFDKKLKFIGILS